MQKGLVYIPYIMSESVSIISETDFKPKKSLSARYMSGGIDMKYAASVVMHFPKKETHKQKIDKIIERL
jgi:hypothetical protein